MLCTFNIRGAHYRGTDLKKFILDNNIAFTAIQEPKLTPNNLPAGYDKKTLMLPHDPPGIRGLMWVFHPNWADKYSRPPTPVNQNIAWIKVDLDPKKNQGIKSILLANVYLSPLAIDKTDVHDTVKQLIEDVAQFLKDPCNAVVLMGDWNYDPFTKKGTNDQGLEDIVALTPILPIGPPRRPPQSGPVVLTVATLHRLPDLPR